MTLGQAIVKKLCIQHAMSGAAIYPSAQTRIRLDAFTHALPNAVLGANVLSFQSQSTEALEKPRLKIPMPANDNLGPLA